GRAHYPKGARLQKGRAGTKLPANVWPGAKNWFSSRPARRPRAFPLDPRRQQMHRRTVKTSRAVRKPRQLRAACYHASVPPPVCFSMASTLPATEITALLGRGTHFEGKLHFSGRVRIDGGFRGDIQSDDTLIIGEGAQVEGEIDVAMVIIK